MNTINSLKFRVCIGAILAHMLLVSNAAVIELDDQPIERAMPDYDKYESNDRQESDENIAKLLAEQRYRLGKE